MSDRSNMKNTFKNDTAELEYCQDLNRIHVIWACRAEDPFTIRAAATPTFLVNLEMFSLLVINISCIIRRNNSRSFRTIPTLTMRVVRPLLSMLRVAMCEI